MAKHPNAASLSAVINRDRRLRICSACTDCGSRITTRPSGTVTGGAPRNRPCCKANAISTSVRFAKPRRIAISPNRPPLRCCSRKMRLVSFAVVTPCCSSNAPSCNGRSAPAALSRAASVCCAACGSSTTNGASFVMRRASLFGAFCDAALSATPLPSAPGFAKCVRALRRFEFCLPAIPKRALQRRPERRRRSLPTR